MDTYIAVSPYFCISVGAGHEEIVRWLVNNDLTGTIAFIQDNNGDTPAHDAADNGYMLLLCEVELQFNYCKTLDTQRF